MCLEQPLADHLPKVPPDPERMGLLCRSDAENLEVSRFELGQQRFGIQWI